MAVTVENRIVVGLKDVVAVLVTCVKCRAETRIRTDTSDGMLDSCPQCAERLKDPRRMSTAEKLLDTLRNPCDSLANQVRLEISSKEMDSL